MVIYTCERCGMTFNKTSNYKKHLERKNKCKNKFECDICNKPLSNAYSLRRHKDTLHRPPLTQDKQDLLALQEQYEKLKQENNQLRATQQPQQIINNITNVVDNSQKTINLNNFGHEDLSTILKDNNMINLIKNHYLPTADLMLEDIYFRKDIPKNNIIKNGNKALETIDFYENGEFKERDLKSLSPIIFERVVEILKEYVEHHKNQFTDKERTFVDNISFDNYKGGEDDTAFTKTILRVSYDYWAKLNNK